MTRHPRSAEQDRGRNLWNWSWGESVRSAECKGSMLPSLHAPLSSPPARSEPSQCCKETASVFVLKVMRTTAEFLSLSSTELFKGRKMYRMYVLSIWTMSWFQKQESTNHSVTGVHKNKGNYEIKLPKWHLNPYIEIGGAHSMRTWSGIRGNGDTGYANYVQSCWTARNWQGLVLISCKLVCIRGRCRKRAIKPQRGHKRPSKWLIDKQTSDHTCYLDTTQHWPTPDWLVVP